MQGSAHNYVAKVLESTHKGCWTATGERNVIKLAPARKLLSCSAIRIVGHVKCKVRHTLLLQTTWTQAHGALLSMFYRGSGSQEPHDRRHRSR